MEDARRGANADDTFAKLMRVNAWVRAERPAFRLKELGIWRTWTWAQAYQETRALAQGLADLGVERGDRVAVAGANRPRLYWCVAAAQMLGAIPVPLYADSVAEEIADVLEMAGAKIVVAQDQEQVDKMLLIWPRLPGLGHVLFEEPRGLEDYDDPRVSSLDALAETDREKFLPLAPDVVVELRSESDRLPPLKAKMEEYLSAGVTLALLIDPARCKLYVYRPGAEVIELVDPSTLDCSPELPGFVLELKSIFNPEL